MTRTLILALAFTFVALPAWSSSARACGGYGVSDPQTPQVESAVRTHFASHRQQVRLIAVDDAGAGQVASSDRLVQVRFARGEKQFVQTLRLSNERGSWRVVGGEQPRRA